MTGESETRDATEALRSGIASLLRRAPRNPRAPDDARLPSETGRPADVRGRREESLEDLAGAELRAIDGQEVLVIRRDVEDLLPGNTLHRELDTGFAQLSGRDPDTVYAGLRPAVGHALRDVVVLDLETTGFWGCPIFLTGMLFEDEGKLVSVQVLARDYPEEKGMLAVANALLKERKLIVTFNGKSYDLPCFRERCGYHRVRTAVHRMTHVDVLHAARRRWKEELPDCRLQTLEWEVVGLHRTGDVPSADIPGVYHAYVASGNAEALRPVLHHGRVDVMTTATLLARLLADPPSPYRPRRKGRAAE